MKVSSRLDGSLCAVLSNRPTASFGVTTARRSICNVKYVKKETQRKRLNPSSNPSCSRSSLWLLSTFTPATEARRALSAPRPRHASKNYSTAAATSMPPINQRFHTQYGHDPRHLMDLVPQEDAGTVEEHLDFYRDPYRRGYARPDGQEVQVSENRRDVEYPTTEELFKTDDETKRLIAKLCNAVSYKLRHPYRTTLEPIYNMYLQLPEPRMLHLTWQWRNRLLKVMGTPPRRNSESMLRYFALVADVKNAGLTLRLAHWNYALAFATKYSARVTSTEMDTALRLWKEMERSANVKGNEVTFNILFDVASKAGNFVLADMIYKEMETRGFEFNRYHHVSLIHYFGLRLDSNGIRAAYKDMVEAGEMIDTVVLNCVISGLLRCGEESAAEMTYERMKSGHEMAPNIPGRDYGMGRVVTKVLMMFTRIGRKHPELQKPLQKQMQLSPNLHTYKLFVEHYSVKIGDLAKVAQYLDEMKFLKIPIHATIFLSLFKGFYSHGGFTSSEWSEQRLEGVLNAMYQARDESIRGFTIDRWLVIWALRATKKCCSDETVVQVYDEMAKRWDIPLDRQPFIQSLLQSILDGADMKSSTGQWEGPSYRRYKKDGTRL
jgi:pentatricopeptide repeat protein